MKHEIICLDAQGIPSAHCKVCRLEEHQFTTDCPERLVTMEEYNDINIGYLDFKDGEWVKLREDNDLMSKPTVSNERMKAHIAMLKDLTHGLRCSGEAQREKAVRGLIRDLERIYNETPS